MILLDAFRVHALHDPGNIIMRATTRSAPVGKNDTANNEAANASVDGALTYREAWNVSELLGAHLIERTEQGKLTRTETIAILEGRHPLLLSCCFACAKAGHPYYRIDDTSPKALERAASFGLVLSCSVQISQSELEAYGISVLNAHKIRSYLVPGMTDDFSCGCGTQDCEHGPFLQECSPAEWLDDTEVFAFVDGQTMTVLEHDSLLVDALEKDTASPATLATGAALPLDPADPHIAAIIAQGGEVVPLSMLP